MIITFNFEAVPSIIKLHQTDKIIMTVNPTIDVVALLNNNQLSMNLKESKLEATQPYQTLITPVKTS